MRRFVLTFGLLFWMFGCGGDGGGGPTTPPDVPNIAGPWSGTETVVIRGGTQCGTLEAGTRTASPMFNVAQNDRQIRIFLSVNCVLCEFAGTIAANGSFTASGTGPTATVPLVGQVNGNQMTATRGPPRGIDCDAVGTYNLTRG